MTTIVKRIVKGSTLTVAELDANVNNLNNTKLETTGGTLTGLPVLANQDVDIISPVYPTTKPSLNLDFTRGQLDPRITFVRNSTATYYDGQTTAMAEQNLLLNSVLSSATSWGGSLSTLTFNYGAIAAPDGSFTATRCQPTLTVDKIEQFITALNVGGTKSIWARTITGTADANLMNYIGSDPRVFTLTTTWQRFTVTTINSVIYNMFELYDARIATHTATDFLVWAPQAENRSSATAYTPTTTAAITNYIPVLMTAPAGVARFDCDPITGKSLGLLIEESRTNLVLQSQFASGFTFVRTTQNINTIIAPDGTLTASKIIPTNVNGSHAFYKDVTVVSGTSSTWSGYFKAGEYNTIHLNCQASASIYIVKFNLTSGTSTNVSGTGTASITLVGNGWYRCTATATTASTSGYWQFDIYDNSGNTVYTGDGYSGIYIWGAQLEAGSFATSYIPTVASTVTRAADQASITGTNFSSWWNVSQSTFRIEFDKLDLTNVGTLINVYGGSSTSSIEVDSIVTGANQLVIRQPSNTLVNSIGSSSLSSNRFAVSFGANLFAPYAGIGAINGASGAFGTGAYFPNPLFNSLYIGLRQHFGDQKLNGHIKKISYYPVALSSSNLVALTS